MEQGARRAFWCWPRRAGKDTLSLEFTCYDSQRTVGNYLHCFPEQAQGRKALWNGITGDGSKFIDRAFPRELRASTLDNEMLIKFKNGSTWQLGGSDRHDALIGTNYKGIVFSEYCAASPRAYQYLRPILAENGGWALFPSTPRGKNHGFELFETLKADPGSFAEILTVEDTGHMPEAALALERRELSESFFNQEYYCSFEHGSEGLFYSVQMNRAVTEGRVCEVPYDESQLTWCAWDIGLSDSTALWWFQVMPGGSIHWIDFHEASGEQLKYYADVIRSKPYTLGSELILPHDAGHQRLGMESVDKQLQALGFGTRVLPVERSVMPGIEACRVAINRSYFDYEKTRFGRQMLNAYQREHDEKHDVWKVRPLHNYASDAADSFRYAVRAINAGHCARIAFAPVDYSALNQASI